MGDLRMAQYGIAFYWSKYYELFDTVSWMAVYSRIYMGWFTSFNNTGVHVIMYYYFAVYALGMRPTWKKYLTSLQILQFVADMSSSLPFIIFFFMGIPCRGELYA